MPSLFLRSRACALLATVLCWLGLAGSAAADTLPSGRLVDVDWLQRHRAEVVLIDASMTPHHAAGHIPGALSADRYRYGALDPTPQQMARRLQALGIDPGEKIVIYDQGADFLAPRLFYDLYYHGVPAADIHLLDGGLAAWRAAGGAVTQDATPTPAPGTIEVTTTRESARVRLDAFLVASGDRDGHVLLDALEPGHYYGAQKFFDRAGHVPNAVLLPSSDFYRPDKTFKPAAEIRRLLRYAGIRPDQVVHTHCGGGGAAAVPWFALRFIAGHPRVTLYQESQREWLQDERGLPFWTYAEPRLLREADWVAGWNAPMLRAFGITRHAIVDVRPATAYARDHVPFALSLPAPVFRAHLGAPAALAARLGPAGVDPEEPVVIVSDGGLTPDAALAFLAFEQLGHARVSVLMASVDDWGLGGHPLTKQPTRVGVPGPTDEPTVPPATYVARGGGAVVSDPSTARGEFARVFVAAGRDTPSRTPDGPVLRLPFADLLDAAGRPRPAAELLRVFEQAGVPRHAEVVLFADDPAEAAVAYVVFRLMGWPDVKVWAT